jgi:hypothetical protein
MNFEINWTNIVIEDNKIVDSADQKYSIDYFFASKIS